MTLRPLPTLYAVSAAVAALILGPLLGGGHLLFRDAVSTPRSHLTDAALGLGLLPPRAVPQEWLLAVMSSVVDGGIVVMALLAAALICAGVGFGLLALRLVPAAGVSGASIAAVVGIWNPFVVERLLQGHWSLLAGYATLGWLALWVRRLATESRSGWDWLRLGGLCAVAGLTPTGSLFAAVVAVAAAATALPGWRWRPVLAGCGIWVLGSLPWLAATALGSASTSADGPGGAATAFGLRSEPLLGPLGTAAGLGGIWNADAVPTSRAGPWAAVATLVFLAVVAAGGAWLWRRRRSTGRASDDDRLLCALVVLGAATVMLVAVTAAGPGQALLGWLIDTVPGTGLLRDAQKYLALAVPMVAVAVAAAVAALRVWLPAGFAVAIALLLTVAPLPDAAWGVGGELRPVTYPDDWAAVAELVPADAGPVALWPPGTFRQYDFADAVSLSPAPRMLRAPVLESGELRVDGAIVDPPHPAVNAVNQALRDGGDPAVLAGLGVSWVLVEKGTPTDLDSPPILLARTTQPVFDGADLALYRVDSAAMNPSFGPAEPWRRAAMWTAHVLWLGLAVAGVGVAAVRYSGQIRTNP